MEFSRLLKIGAAAAATAAVINGFGSGYDCLEYVWFSLLAPLLSKTPELEQHSLFGFDFQAPTNSHKSERNHFILSRDKKNPAKLFSEIQNE